MVTTVKSGKSTQYNKTFDSEESSGRPYIVQQHAIQYTLMLLSDGDYFLLCSFTP